MNKRLSELEDARIDAGNRLVLPCQGEHDCGGMIGVPFKPGIDRAPDGEPLRPGGPVWNRVSGDSLKNLTLSPSIDAHECGHFHITNGEIVF